MNIMRKYLAFARVAGAHAVAERHSLYGQAVFLIVLLGIFAGLWNTVADTSMPLPAGPADLVWYMAVTEWILMSVPLVHRDIEADVRRGDIAYQVARPVSYVGSWLAQAAGGFIFRAPWMALVAFGGAWLFTGHLPQTAVWYAVVPLGLAAGLVLAALHVLLGLLAFWLPDISPAYWVAQKSLFVLGGLTLPISLYPDWARQFAMATPFPWLLWGPASHALGSDDAPGLAVAGFLALWGGLTLALTAWLYGRALGTLHVNGG